MENIKKDLWAPANQEFYDLKSISKKSPKIFKPFVFAYKKLLQRFPSILKAHVLDIGCGSGYLTRALSLSAKKIVGFDLSNDSLKVAKEQNPGELFFQADMVHIPTRASSFDLAVAMTSIEFCFYKENVLLEVGRLLKEEGYFYLEVRNRDFVLYRLPEGFLEILKKFKMIVNAPGKDFRDLSYSEWVLILKRAGFSILNIHSSIRPWNYGPIITRIKNIIIQTLDVFLPIKKQYMIGFLCVKLPKKG